MPRPGESVREMLAQQSTEKALTAMDPDRELTDEQRQAREESREAFWRSLRKPRRRPWK